MKKLTPIQKLWISWFERGGEQNHRGAHILWFMLWKLEAINKDTFILSKDLIIDEVQFLKFIKENIKRIKENKKLNFNPPPKKIRPRLKSRY